MTDDMPGWVCAVGGYEFLLSDNPNIVQAAKEWLIRFGDGHKPIRGTGLDVLHRYHGAHHYGFAWWGPPAGWVPSLADFMTFMKLPPAYRQIVQRETLSE